MKSFKKGMLMVILMLALVFSFAIPVFAAGHAGETIDINDDGVADITLSDTVTYGIMVPENITVDGGAGAVYVKGYTDGKVTISAPSEVTMAQDGKLNELSANISMENVVLPISIAAPGEAEQNVSASWGTAPSLGSWTGTFEYTVNTAA